MSDSPYYAPWCRQGWHLPIEHHERFTFLVGKDCDCPCHRGNAITPWWSEITR